MQATVESFISRWQGQEGGQERANYALFLTELCDLLGLPHAQPASATSDRNDYVFERVVKEPAREGAATSKRIDLYKRDCFILEAKQSRMVGDKKLSNAPQLPGIEVVPRGRRQSANRSWDVLMLNARAQAENYVRLLPPGHEPPPFVLVCDVGHAIEVYANFRRDGKAYDQFPDRRSFRIYLEDLRDPAVRARLIAIWSDPLSLDPSRHAARVTREIAGRIAKVSKALENQGHATEDVALFLMRMLFTMFAEDVDLLPRDCFKQLLKDCAEKPDIFPSMMGDLWKAMDEGGFTATIREKVKRFNGEFFKNRRALPLAKEEIGELAAAARYDWKDVEPAIFGTFLEQALDPVDRRKLGAHYTPRAYVERLVIATVIDPLRSEWDNVRTTADRQKAEGKPEAAIKTVQAFHDRLCKTRVLDPACGTGNFLYVALELLKRLEGEVLEALVNLGGQEGLALESHTVDPHQFLGIEVNPRAAAIAELVLWIGHLQWHFRNRGVAPSEPILKAFKNIQTLDAVLTWDGYPLPKVVNGEDSYPNPRRPAWPDADYIVGNPPFLGKGEPMRTSLGDAKLKALWKANNHMNESADFVMYWWDHAADLLSRPRTALKRFGFVTTNSIGQVFNRRVMESFLNAKKPLSIIMAIPDHPWTKVTRDSAAVRIAMTVVEAGRYDGRLLEVTAEEAVATDSPVIQFYEKQGRVNSDLTIGVDVTRSVKLASNEGLASNGVLLAGRGFLIEPSASRIFGGDKALAEGIIRPYINGRELISGKGNRFVLDVGHLEIESFRSDYPSIYQRLATTVRVERETLLQTSRTKDALEYATHWFRFAKPRRALRDALRNVPRYIATTETTKHRHFQFVDSRIIPDHMVVAIAMSEAWQLGILSSHVHVMWAIRTGGWLGVGNDARYSKSRCFDPFPFPAATETQKALIGAIAEGLDAHRKQVLADHPHLTLTGLYNVLERLKAGATRDMLSDKERRIFDDGLVLILKERHERLDSAVADAYGWPVDLPEEEVLARLVSLNRERVKEEARGLVRWLRPDYQIPRFGSAKEKAEQLEADLGEVVVSKGAKPNLPSSDTEQTAFVIDALIDSGGFADAAAVAARFKQGQKIRPAVIAVLASLHRMGLVSTSDGKIFTWRRAA